MFLKSLISLFAVVIVLIGSVAAQETQPIAGVVQIEKDGKRSPLASVKVDLYREDVKGQGQTQTSDAEGKFRFEAVQTGHTYILSISAPGASPNYESDVLAGMQNLVLLTIPGDGRSVNEDQLKEAIAKATASMSEEDKKKAAERKKIADKNKKVEQSGKIIQAAIKDGNDAFNKNDFTTAIAKYDEGVAAEPDFEGSAPTLLSNKGAALQSRARGYIIDAQKGDAAAKAAALEKAKADYDLAIASYDRGLEIIAKAPADSTAKASLPENRKSIYRNYLITLGQMYETSVPVSENVDAAKVVDGYIQSATDPKQRTADLLGFGDKAMRGGAVEASAMAFKKILETNAKDLDALSGAAVALGALAFMTDPPNKAHLQEASKFAKQYMDAAPKDHKNQSAVADIMESIKAVG